MSAQPKSQGALGKGDVIHLRYKITEVLEAPTSWGAAYVVEDMEEEGAERIARQLNVPPQRQGLEARMQAVRDAITTVRLEADPHLPRIVDFFEEGKGKKDGKRVMWVVIDRPAGSNADSLVAESRGGIPRELGGRVALELARAFKVLLDTGQKQALAGVDSRHVYISEDGEVQVADLALILLLRPGSVSWHVPASVPDPQPAALEKIGALVSGLLTGTPLVDTAAFQESDLPADLGPIIGRTLHATAADGYKTLDKLIADLEALPGAQKAQPDEDEAVSAAPPQQPPAEPPPAQAPKPSEEVAAASPAPSPAPAPEPEPAPEAAAPPVRVAASEGRAARSAQGVLGPGDLLRDRYKVLEMLEAPSLWGAMYVVVDMQAPTVKLIARQMNIPPLRQELEERVEAVRHTVALLRENPDASRPGIVDFFEDGQKMWLISKKVVGSDVETLVKTRKTISKTDWRARVALRLAEAIQSLYDLGQKQAIADLTPRKVMLTTDARVFIVSYGLGLFLRPGPVNYHKPGAVPEAEKLAVKRFGEIMYGLLTGELYHDGQVIVDADLPEGLGYVVLRALIPSRRDAYKSIDTLIADLQVLQNLMEHERMDVLHWEDFELPKEQPPVWDQIGIPRFLLRTLVVWARAFRDFFMSQSLIARAWQSMLVVLLVMAWGHDLYQQRHTPRDYRKSGPAVYISDSKGAIQVWDANDHRLATTLEVAHPVGGFLYSKRTQRLYVSIPAEKAVDMYFPGEASLLGETKVPGGTGELWPLGTTAMAATMSSDGNMSQINLRTLTSMPAVRLPETPIDIAWAEGRQALLLVKINPPRIEAYSKLQEKSQGEEPLEIAPKLIRVTPDAKEAWVGTTSGEGVILVVDPSTLATAHKVELGRGHVVDIVFTTDLAWVLLQEGELLTVDRATYKLVGRSVTVGKGGVGIVQGLPREMWVPSAAEQKITVFNLDSERTQDIPLKAVPTHAAVVP